MKASKIITSVALATLIGLSGCGSSDSTTDSSTTINSESIVYMTPTELSSGQASGVIPQNMYHYNISMSIYEDEDAANDLFNSVTNQEMIASNIFYVDDYTSILNTVRVYFLGIEIDGSNLKIPNFSNVVREDSISDDSSWSYNGRARFTKTDEYIHWGGNDYFKFSKALDYTMLNTLYTTNMFQSGDLAQFVYEKETRSIYTNLYYNQSAKDNLLKLIQSEKF